MRVSFPLLKVPATTGNGSGRSPPRSSRNPPRRDRSQPSRFLTPRLGSALGRIGTKPFRLPLDVRALGHASAQAPAHLPPTGWAFVGCVDGRVQSAPAHDTLIADPDRGTTSGLAPALVRYYGDTPEPDGRTQRGDNPKRLITRDTIGGTFLHQTCRVQAAVGRRHDSWTQSCGAAHVWSGFSRHLSPGQNSRTADASTLSAISGQATRSKSQRLGGSGASSGKVVPGHSLTTSTRSSGCGSTTGSASRGGNVTPSSRACSRTQCPMLLPIPLSPLARASPSRCHSGTGNAAIGAQVSGSRAVGTSRTVSRSRSRWTAVLMVR